MFTFWWPMFIIYVFWNDTSAVYVLLIDWGISVHQSKSAYIYIHIWNEELKSKTSGKIYMKTKYEIILQCSTDFFFHKVLFLLHFEFCQNCMSFANLAAEIHQSFEHWRTMYLWICCFAPVISQRCIKYTLVHSSKLLAYLFSLRLI